MTLLPSTRGAGVLRAILFAIAALAIALPAFIVAHAPVIVPRREVVVQQRRIVPRAELPAVEPVKFVDLPPEDARAFNATVPFSDEPNPAARPFRFVGDPDQHARALDCLAAGVLYEAGDDAEGERAVAQVVLNRLRHPAFPKTVCGVVFEGSDRTTGCQFTFTCDGALARHPSDAGWTRARQVAGAALAGSVYKPVGYATHYHTDWVVPYWQSSLDKVAAVHTHLFFRWSGWWGTPPAFNRSVSSDEPVIAKLAALSDAHRMAGALDEAGMALAESAAALGPAPSPIGPQSDSFLVTLPRGASADALPLLAAKACGDRAYCKYMAWSDGTKTPAALPLEPRQIAAMTFSYLRDRNGGYEKALWNCQQAKRADPGQCMKMQILMTAEPVATTLPKVSEVSKLSKVSELSQVSELGGVRRIEDPGMTRPSPTPSPRP